MPSAQRGEGIHEPHCNTNCQPARHYLASGVGMPHIHRTDLATQCGACERNTGTPAHA